MPDLSESTVNELMARARSLSQNAYCPYSRFPVGAAVLADTGDVFTGCNVENASYGLASCAERNAIFQMVAGARQRLVAVVIYTPTRTPAAPCGACRQVINEFGPRARVICICDGPQRIDTTLDRLMPRAFGPRNLDTASGSEHPPGI